MLFRSRGEKLTKQEEQSIKAMDSALQKMPKYEGTVKRSLSDFGIPDVDEFVKSYVPGELKIFNEYILNFYDSNFGCEDFLRIIDWMPYIIELDFESSCNEMESECPIYSFKLIAKQEHCYIEKEFKGK